MLTDRLEKLILCGKASYNTFVVGGSEKYILNVKPDHYIIITSINFQNIQQVKADGELGYPLYAWDEVKKELFVQNTNTQLKIFSNKSNNSFLFRNNFDLQRLYVDGPGTGFDKDKYLVIPKNHYDIDTYLIHETDVSFTFSNVGRSAEGTRDYTPNSSIGYPPPFDYGKESQPGSLKVRLKTVEDTTGTYGSLPVGEQYKSIGLPGDLDNLEFIFPVDSDHQLQQLDFTINYPIVNVQYVEIKGRITDIEATL